MKKIRAGLYEHRGRTIEHLNSADGDWNGYAGLWRVTENGEAWYMHYKTLKAAKCAIDEEIEAWADANARVDLKDA
jgi:hypothetical protein